MHWQSIYLVNWILSFNNNSPATSPHCALLCVLLVYLVSCWVDSHNFMYFIVETHVWMCFLLLERQWYLWKQLCLNAIYFRSLYSVIVDYWNWAEVNHNFCRYVAMPRSIFWKFKRVEPASIYLHLAQKGKLLIHIHRKLLKLVRLSSFS